MFCSDDITSQPFCDDIIVMLFWLFLCDVKFCDDIIHPQMFDYETVLVYEQHANGSVH